MNFEEIARTWDERYLQEKSVYGEQPNDFLKAQEQRILAGGRRALCLGEGEGRNAIWLAQLGLDVTAVDLSSVGLKKAAARAEALGVALTTVQADLSKWRIEPGAWDLIVSIFCHLPHEIRAAVNRQVVAGLRPRGLFITEAYRPTQIARGTGGPSDPAFLPTLTQLRSELAGLDFIEGQEITREVLEGSFHTGVSDVVQVVAQKRT